MEVSIEIIDQVFKSLIFRFIDVFDRPLESKITNCHIKCTPEQFNEAKSIGLHTDKNKVILNEEKFKQVEKAILSSLFNELKVYSIEVLKDLSVNTVGFQLNAFGMLTPISEESAIFYISKNLLRSVIKAKEELPKLSIIPFKEFQRFDIRRPDVSQQIYNKILVEVINRLRYEDIVSNKQFTLPDFGKFIKNINNGYYHFLIDTLKIKFKSNIVRSLCSQFYGLEPINMSLSEISSLKELGYVRSLRTRIINHNDLTDLKHIVKREGKQHLFILKNYVKFRKVNISEKNRKQGMLIRHSIDVDLSNSIMDYVYNYIQDRILLDLDMFLSKIRIVEESRIGKIEILTSIYRDLQKKILDRDLLTGFKKKLHKNISENIKYEEVFAFISKDIKRKESFLKRICGISQFEHDFEIELELKKLELLKEKIKELSESSKKQETINSTPPKNIKENTTKQFNTFDSLFKDDYDKDFVLEMLNDLKITKNGVYDNEEKRGKSRVRGVVEALMEREMLAKNNIHKKCELFALKIEMEYKSRLKKYPFCREDAYNAAINHIDQYYKKESN